MQERFPEQVGLAHEAPPNLISTCFKFLCYGALALGERSADLGLRGHVRAFKSGGMSPQSKAGLRCCCGRPAATAKLPGFAEHDIQVLMALGSRFHRFTTYPVAGTFTGHHLLWHSFFANVAFAHYSGFVTYIELLALTKPPSPNPNIHCGL
jgi:hypothetical protein